MLVAFIKLSDNLDYKCLFALQDELLDSCVQFHANRVEGQPAS